MKYRAIFIGGPLDGQERVLAGDYGLINVPSRGPPAVTYRLLFGYGQMPTLIYSLCDIEETLNRLVNRYMGEDKAC
jgi:hypothetical protein